MPGEAEIATQAVGTLTGAVQSISGLIEKGKANKNLKRLFAQRKAFQTPSEIFDILNLQMNNQAGFSPETLSYLTGGANAGLSSSLGTAQLLGADPNGLSSLIDRYSRDIFGIGKESELVKMKKFDGILNALQLVANNKEAEWASKENLIKDQMAAEAQKVAAAGQAIQSGGNLALNSIGSYASSNLYGNDGTRRRKNPLGDYGGATGGDPSTG